MALSKAELKALIKTSLGPLGEKINERREAAEEAAAAATAKTAETDQTAAAEFGRLCRDVAVSRRSFSDDGELTATADPQGALRTPGMSPSGKTMALVLRGLAAAFAQKARQGEAHDVAAEFIAEHYADSSRAEPAIKSLMTGKTLVTTNQAGAGVLVAGPAKAAMVELLRPQAVLTALGARDINLPPGGLTMPVQATSGSGVWLGETEAVPASQPSFSSKTMKGYKYASLVLVSEELMAGADLNVEQFIMDDLRLDAGTAIDIAFLRGNDNVRPRGVRHLGIPTATTGTTDAQVDADLVGAIMRMGESGLPMARLGWGISWRSWMNLYNRRFTNGGYVFRAELDAGRLLGFPFRRSSNIPSNLGGGGNESEIYLFELDNVLIGYGDAIGFDISQDATVVINGVVTSAFQQYLRAIRMMLRVDIQLRHPEAVQIITGVQYGV